MAVQKPAVTPAAPTCTDAHVATWVLASGDTATPIQVPEQSDRSAQIDGTFGGATAGVEGSLDGVTYFTLHDPQGVPITTPSGKLAAVLELVNYARPFVTGGDVSTAVSVKLLHKKAR